MALQDSTFKYTDVAVTPFVVKPYTANGPASPASSGFYTDLAGVSAVSANTSLTFVGRGLPYYGEVVQNNLIYLMEHFANQTAPTRPVIGQIWYQKPGIGVHALNLWTGSDWYAIPMQGSLSPELNLNGNRIKNVGTAIEDGDALSRITGDQRYVTTEGPSSLAGIYQLSAGSLTIDQGANLLVMDLPSSDNHAVNRAALNLTRDSILASLDTLTQQVAITNTNIGSALTASGGTLTGNLVLTSSATLIVQPGGSAPLFGGRQLSAIALTPVALDDASSKKYVDDNVTALQAADTTISGNVTALASTVASTYVPLAGGVLTGGLILASTSNLSLLAGGTMSIGNRRIQNVGTPIVTTDAATKQYVDTAVAVAGNAIRRYVVTASGSPTFTLPASMTYKVHTNKLMVHMDGIKQYAHGRGKSTVTFTDTLISATSNTGLTPSTAYSVTTTVDGATPVVVTITTGTGNTSFTALVSLLNTAAQLASAALYFTLDAYSSTAIEIVGTSYSSGNASSVVISYATGSTFNAIATSSAPVSVDGVAYAYAENGVAGGTATGITFDVTPTTGSVLEILLFP